MTFTLSSDPHPTKPYEPTPRFEHFATSVGGKCYLWGGHILDCAVSDLTSNVEVFDPNLEAWEKCPTTGVPPLGLHNAACATLLDSVYWFGGFDGHILLQFLSQTRPHHTGVEGTTASEPSRWAKKKDRVWNGSLSSLPPGCVWWPCMAFPQVVLGSGGVISSMCSTSQKVCEHCLIHLFVSYI